MVKKNYVKPAVKKVKLMIEETLLAQCKTSAGDARGRGGRGCSAGGCRGTYGS